MSIPALEALRAAHPHALITILARPWVADVYQGAPFCDQLLLYHPPPGWREWGAKRRLARVLRAIGFDLAVLLPNSFEAALVAWWSDTPERVGYARDGRSWLLTRAIPPPRPGESPVHERFYYLELLRRAGLIDSWPEDAPIRLPATPRPFADLDLPQAVVGVSPGAAFGTAKRWLPERFAAAAVELAREHEAAVVVFGSRDEREVCEQVAAQVERAGVTARSLAGETTLREFMDRAAACRLFLTNDNGAMHLVSALGVPAVAVFGSTDHTTTGPVGEQVRIVREAVECSPCLKRHCPIDHRCMTRVSPERVVEAARSLVQIRK
jgi:heptosyltransferase-2